MKKILVFVIVVALATGGYVYKKQSLAKMSSVFLLENIEALAVPETSTGFCLGIGSIDCPLNHIKVYTYDVLYSIHY
ncbi:NVEALA domain-containing protein [Bacteroides sp. UBA939]|uniref:NVEALA domain-containing protein n=1 Tax=Bacteroides sp. UBA939 TaxID=1946092 RepID=UPI0025C21261|nr:NVEALA domain-containing protein [Bacteroides sp. UBA939]